jgi:hypothetical protein
VAWVQKVNVKQLSNRQIIRNKNITLHNRRHNSEMVRLNIWRRPLLCDHNIKNKFWPEDIRSQFLFSQFKDFNKSYHHFKVFSSEKCIKDTVK